MPPRRRLRAARRLGAPRRPAPPPRRAGPLPAGWAEHDLHARTVVRRYVGNLAPALKGIYGDAAFAKLADILGAADDYPELKLKPAFAQVPQLVLNDLLTPLKPELDGKVKVFKLTIDDIDQHIDELLPTTKALGYNKQWPGPTIRVTQGDQVRAIFTNNLKETTGVHFHGVDVRRLLPGRRPVRHPEADRRPARPTPTSSPPRTPGSLMYHSHHNATDQVGHGLLGAFIVDPKPDPVKVDRDYVWISNDSVGGFTINGHGFPATVPVLAAVGETVRIRFMNEGIMMHPWHIHGNIMKVIERDGRPLGSAAFECDTLGRQPGRALRRAHQRRSTSGLWAFHCHILPHAEATAGMFGMVNTMIVVPKKEHVDAIVKALTS